MLELRANAKVCCTSTTEIVSTVYLFKTKVSD